MAERRVTMLEMLKSFWTDESGQGLTEYALIIALVSILLIAALLAFSEQIQGVFTRIGEELAKYPETAPAGE
jgi:pilus assembly protein Flp/PilA